MRRALSDGRLVQTFSFRGSVQVMAPETAGVFLALRAAGRQWALRSWVDHYRLRPDEWPDLRAIVRGVVAAGPVAPQVVADELAGNTRFAHLAKEFARPNHTLLKPLAWQGDIVLGPDLDGPLTLQSPALAPAWVASRTSTPPATGPCSTTSPATAPRRRSTCTTGSAKASARDGPASSGGGRRSRDQVVEVDVEGERRWLLSDHVDELAALRPEAGVVLLPGKDAWVMGPGTKDEWVVPAEHRTLHDARRPSGRSSTGSSTGRGGATATIVEVTCSLAGDARAALAAEVDLLAGLLEVDLSLRTP